MNRGASVLASNTSQFDNRTGKISVLKMQKTYTTLTKNETDALPDTTRILELENSSSTSS